MKPVFCKPRKVPFAILEYFNYAYDVDIKKTVWASTHFNEYGMSVLSTVKALLPGQQKAKLRVNAGYSVMVNLQTHHSYRCQRTECGNLVVATTSPRLI